MNNIITTVTNGGLGRKDLRTDNISALVFANNAPAIWATSKIKGFRSLEDLAANGVTAVNGYAEMYYHASEFFRFSPGALLYMCFNINFPADLMAATNGSVKQVGVFFSNFTVLQSVYQAAADTMDGLKCPIFIVAGYDSTTALNLATCTDLATIVAPNVSVVAFGDGAAKGKTIATSLGKPYIPAVGSVLGVVAKANVHESIAWVEKFNMSDGKELEVIRLADGNNTPTENTLEGMSVKRYIVGRKFVGRSGTYLNDNATASPILANDYAYMNDVRVMNKAKRALYSALLPKLNSPVFVDPTTGAIRATTVDTLEILASQALNVLLSADEISGFDVYIDPDQDVLGTSTLKIQVRIVVNGVARNIVLDLGLVTKLQA